MAHPRTARSVLGLIAAIAVAGALLVPPNSIDAHAAPQSTPKTVGLSGEIPCVDASEAEFKAIGCRVVKLTKRSVADNSVVPIVTSGRSHNCDPTTPNPAGPGTSIQASVGVSATSSVSSGANGASMIAHGTTVNVAPMVGGSGPGGWAYHYMNTQVTGWDWTTTNAWATNYSITESRTEQIKPYHWAFWTFRPQYREVELLWTWSEPAMDGQRSGFRASGIQTVRYPVFRDGQVPPDNDADGKVVLAANTILGDWKLVQIAMTPAEILACETPEGPATPSFYQPTQIAPTGTVGLNTAPFLYTVAPPVAPVLRNLAGTGSRLIDPQLLVGNTANGPVFDAPIKQSLQLTGDSEVGFWTAGNCSTFTARVGYGANLVLARPGYARDTVQVWSAKVDGRVSPDELLFEGLVPTAPEGADVSGREHFQADLKVDITGAQVLIIKVITGDGIRDSLSDRAPGVLVAEPQISCGGPSETSSFQQSAYPEAIRTTTVNLAGTPEEIEANPGGFMQPSEVNNGWSCTNDPKNDVGVLPRTIVNQACGGAPLTVQGKVYANGIGMHSGSSVRNGATGVASVVWAKTPPTCSALSFGVGFDDHPGFPRETHQVSVYSQLHDPKDGSLDPWSLTREKIGSTLTLSGDGASGVQRFNFAQLGVGSKRIEIVVETGHNGNGHVDIIEPRLTCSVQGSRTESRSTTPDGAPNHVYEISKMDWARQSGFHGPVERDMSNGETGANDGRPVVSTHGAPVMAIGGYSGWSSGVGMAPSSIGREASVDITTAGRCERLTAWVGIDDYAGSNGSVLFKVYVDGEVKATSPVKRGGQAPSFMTVDVSGAHVVTIAANNADNSNQWDHADWAEPKLICSSDPSTANTVAASNAHWLFEQNGWGPAERNMSLGEQAAGDGRSLSIGSYRGWTSGIGVAPSDMYSSIIELEVGSCTHFTAWVGMDDETTWYDIMGVEPSPEWESWAQPFTKGYGSSRFYLYADGRIIAESPLMRHKDAPFFMEADLTGVQKLRLVVHSGGDGNAYDHADWANPTLFCG